MKIIKKRLTESSEEQRSTTSSRSPPRCLLLLSSVLALYSNSVGCCEEQENISEGLYPFSLDFSIKDLFLLNTHKLKS